MEALNALGRREEALADGEAQVCLAAVNGERLFLPALGRARAAAEAGRL